MEIINYVLILGILPWEEDILSLIYFVVLFEQIAKISPKSMFEILNLDLFFFFEEEEPFALCILENKLA